MRVRATIVSALAATALAATPLAAQAGTPTYQARQADQAAQPYTHLVTGKSWSTGGTYVAQGGDITLTLTGIPKATRVFVEECNAPDLGEVQVFTKNAAGHVLATNVAKGTCFLVLFQPQSGNGGYQVTGTLAY